MRVFLFCKPHTPPDVPPPPSLFSPRPRCSEGLRATRSAELYSGPFQGHRPERQRRARGARGAHGMGPKLARSAVAQRCWFEKNPVIPVTSMAGNCPGALVTFTHHPAALFQLSLDLGPRTSLMGPLRLSKLLFRGRASPWPPSTTTSWILGLGWDPVIGCTFCRMLESQVRP